MNKMNQLPFLIERGQRQAPTSLAELAGLSRQPAPNLSPINLPKLPSNPMAKINAEAAQKAKAAEALSKAYASVDGQKVDPEEEESARQRRRYQQMIATKNPELMKRGLDGITELDKESRTPKQSAGYLYATEMGATPGTPAHRKLIKAYAMKAGTNINLSNKKAIAFGDLGKVLVKDPEGNWVAPKAGITPEQLYGMESKLKEELTPDVAGKYAMLKNASDSLDVVKKMLYLSDGKVNSEALMGATAIDKVSNLPIVGKYAASAAKAHFGQQAARLNQGLEVGMQAITRTETGAAMASEEIANTKNRFMPEYGEPPELIDQKIRAYEDFLNTAMTLIRDRTTDRKAGELTREEILGMADKALSGAKASEPSLPEGAQWEED